MNFAAIAEEDECHVIEPVFGPRTFTRKAGEALHPERESLESLKVLLPTFGTITSANATALSNSSPCFEFQ